MRMVTSGFGKVVKGAGGRRVGFPGCEGSGQTRRLSALVRGPGSPVLPVF